MIDIHNYPKRLETAVKGVVGSTISSKNKELILEFRDYCGMERMSFAGISRYMGVLKDWAQSKQKFLEEEVAVIKAHLDNE